jgi:hypothetical protein
MILNDNHSAAQIHNVSDCTRTELTVLGGIHVK